MKWLTGKKKTNQPADNFPKGAFASHPFKGRGSKISKMEVSKKDFAKIFTNSNSKSIPLNGLLTDSAPFYKQFYRLVARFYPMASDAVWVWKYLCSTKQHVDFLGGSDIQKNRHAVSSANACDLSRVGGKGRRRLF